MEGSDGTRWRDWSEREIYGDLEVSVFACLGGCAYLFHLVRVLRWPDVEGVDLFEWWRDFFPRRHARNLQGAVGRGRVRPGEEDEAFLTFELRRLSSFIVSSVR